MFFLLALPLCLTIASPILDSESVETDFGAVVNDIDEDTRYDPVITTPDASNYETAYLSGTSPEPVTQNIEVAEEPDNGPQSCSSSHTYCCSTATFGTLSDSELNGVCNLCSNLNQVELEQVKYKSCCPKIHISVCILH